MEAFLQIHWLKERYWHEEVEITKKKKKMGKAWKYKVDIWKWKWRITGIQKTDVPSIPISRFCYLPFSASPRFP